jgi:hypothetical protein
MIKKIIAYSFILTAGIIILAHDLVPHHHHEKDAIEHSQTCSTQAEKEHHHDFPEHKHQHDDYLFLIRQAFFLSPNVGRLLDNDDDFIGNNGLDYFFIHTPNILIAYSPPVYKIPIRDNPQYFTTAATYTFGLRAPPAV